MILCIDIGNTNIVSALWNGEEFINYNRIESNNYNTTPFIGDGIKEITISSVVPNITKEYINLSKKKYNISPLIINHTNCGITLKVDSPKEVGPDRICNVYAAKELIGVSTIVVDFGSATTYDVINNKGEFIGGAISPGIDVSANNLIKKAALLKETTFIFPKKVIGKNTTTNLQSGIMYAGIDAIDGMLNRIISELDMDMNVVLTGGFSKIISTKLSTSHKLIPMLTLDGIRLINQYNS